MGLEVGHLSTTGTKPTMSSSLHRRDQKEQTSEKVTQRECKIWVSSCLVYHWFIQIQCLAKHYQLSAADGSVHAKPVDKVGS
jgi:hypothetical protein